MTEKAFEKLLNKMGVPKGKKDVPKNVAEQGVYGTWLRKNNYDAFFMNKYCVEMMICKGEPIKYKNQ